MFKLVSTDKRPLTPTVVAEFRRLPAWQGDRPLRSARIADLTRKIEDGRFFSPTWAKSWYGGNLYRMNGQHSSKVLAESNGHFPDGLEVIVHEFKCDSLEDMAELFAQFDCPLSTRSYSDQAIAHARIHPELDSVLPAAVNRALAGIAFSYKVSGSSDKIGHDERAKLVHGNTEFIKRFAHILKPGHLSRAPIVAAMFNTYNKCRGDALAFWELTMNESHPDPANPSRVLALFLRGGAMRGSDSSSAKYSPRGFYAKCVHAWNAWRQKRKTDLKYHAKAELPDPI